MTWEDFQKLKAELKLIKELRGEKDIPILIKLGDGFVKFTESQEKSDELHQPTVREQ